MGLKKERINDLTKEYRPKGRMCIECQYSDRDCSGLRFEAMKPIGKDPDGVIVVKCNDFRK